MEMKAGYMKTCADYIMGGEDFDVVGISDENYKTGHTVISDFPRKCGCSKNRFYNGAVLLLLVFEQAEPAFLSKLTIGQS